MKTWPEEYASQVRAGLSIDSGIDPLSHCALGLAGEAGEVADLIKKSQYKGGKLDKRALVLELGDALWYLTAVAGLLGLALSDIAVENIAKLQVRRGEPYDSMALWNLT